jgi:hypothetical protein
MSKRWAVLAALVCVSSQAAFSQGYGGPSMLSRGGNRPGQRGRAPVDIVVYGGVRGTIETGLTPVRLEEDGAVAEEKSYGVQVELGAYGTHSWRRTTIGLDYRGDYRQATRFAGYNGTNQALSLDLTHDASRRTRLFFRQTGGSTNRAFGGFVAPSVVDPNSFNLANNEVFDTRMYFSQTGAGVSYRTSARATYTLFVDGFFTKRPDRRLIGVAGYRGSAAAEYRVSGRTTVGGTYQYTSFEFKRAFGSAEMHGATLLLVRRFTRNIELNVSGGPAYLISTGTQRVQLSPEVAALLGRSAGVEAFRSKHWVPQVSATLSYALERSRLTGVYMSGVTPGNGVFLTSQMESVSLGYSFTGVRKLSLGTSARYSRMKSKGASLEDLNTVGGGLAANYAFARHLNLSSQFDYRKYRTAGVLGREGFLFTLGLTVSPARLPVSMW